MESIEDQLQNARLLLDQVTVNTDEIESLKVTNNNDLSSGDEEADLGNIDKEQVEDQGFTTVGKNGKKLKKSASASAGVKVTPLFTDAVKSGLQESDFGSTVQNNSSEIPKPEKITFGEVDKKSFDKGQGIKPNYMLNPELFQQAIYELSKKLGVNIYPEVDLFADQWNQQPGVKHFYHWDLKNNKDKDFDAFNQDWSIWKYVYANFFWGKMHDVINKAKESKVNLIAFLDLSKNASGMEYFKLKEDYCRFQYNFTNQEELWVHASESGYQKFMSSHLPKSNGKYSLCFFNFSEDEIILSGNTDTITIENENHGRLQKKIVTSVDTHDGKKISAHQNKNGTVTLKRSVDEAVNISHETVNDEDTIEQLELQIENIFQSKDCEIEQALFIKKQEHFKSELQKYKQFLNNFKEIL